MQGNNGRRLNCLSAGSVSLTSRSLAEAEDLCAWSQLPFGWVCFSNSGQIGLADRGRSGSQLPFGWVCFSNHLYISPRMAQPIPRSQLPFGWVCFSNGLCDFQSCASNARLNCLSAGSVSLTSRFRSAIHVREADVSIAFRLGLFL